MPMLSGGDKIKEKSNGHRNKSIKFSRSIKNCKFIYIGDKSFIDH
jgi:hypothetical protein